MNPTEAIALGEADADIAITGGRVFIAETREFRALDVLIRDNEIAALVADGTEAVGPETTVITADDRAVLPGLIDAHTHVDAVQSLENAYHYALAAGTTTVVTEASAIGGPFGADGVEALLAASAYLPITVRAAVPTLGLAETFEDRRVNDDELDALCELLADDRVVGVGETDWIHVVGQESAIDRLYDRAATERKRISGHGAGCRGDALTAFASIVDDDHEAISADGIIERVERGIHTIGRYGTIRDDIDALAEAVERIGPHELSLSTDGMWPRDLLDEGWMDAVVRRAIESGIKPADALRMATINPARHFGLEDRGSLAPGNAADVVVVDDLDTMNVTTVLSEGELVVRNGESTVAPRNREYPAFVYDSVDVQHDPDVFAIPADVAGPHGEVRAIQLGDGLVTGETTVEPIHADSHLHANPREDIAKVTMLDRHPETRGERFTGFLRGYGIEEGAIATTMTFEATGVLAAGVSDAAISTAVERLVDMGGGYAVVRDGDPIASMPFRIAGCAADLEVEETAKLLNAVESAARTIGVSVEQPLLSLSTLSFVGIPAFRVTAAGYADVLDRSVRGLAPDDTDQ